MGWIMKQIIEYFPKEFNNYHELFAGGLSVLFHLQNCNYFKEDTKIYVNDIMSTLINLYK